MSKTFCPIPWNSISIVNNGDFRVCCNADYKDRIGTLLKDENNKTLNASDDDWSEVRITADPIQAHNSHFLVVKNLNIY